MLLRLIIKNFLSFYEETVFDMFPNPKRNSFPNHIYSDMQIPLLKQAAIYGANGSGKSNFIKAAWFIKSFVTIDDFLSKVDLPDYRFQLVSNDNLKIRFEIEFYHKERYFIYSFEIEKKTINESLKISGLKNSDDKLIFERNGNSIISDHLQNESAAKHLLSLNPYTPILLLNSKYPILSSADVKRAFDWFNNTLDVITNNSTIPALIKLMSKEPKILSFTNEIFENIGIGINKVKVEETPFDKFFSDTRYSKKIEDLMQKESVTPKTGILGVENKKNVFNISFEKGEKKVQELLFDQTGIDGFRKGMKITAQSDGTFRLLTLIPALFSVKNEPKVIFIDEIDNSIHTLLMVNLIKFFSKLETKGQLIYTTHDPELLNQQEVLRPDEVWFTEKDKGTTRMYSLNEFKLHHTINIQNGYLAGRYGGIPFFGNISLLND